MDYITISVPSDANQDDCLEAAAAEYLSEHPEAEGYDLCPRWADEDREEILLDVPELAARHWRI